MVVGPVFRSDTPQSGRYRQFYQFDVDIAGTSSMIADAEIISMMYLTMVNLGVKKFRIHLNNRKILNGLASLTQIQDRENVKADDITREMMRTLDKLDKIGLDEVIKLLQSPPENKFDPSPNLSDDSIEKIKSFLALEGENRAKLDNCKNLFEEVRDAKEGVEELLEIINYLDALQVPSEYIEINFSIARGLDYYTGPVMETILSDAPEFGSVFSGGRFNDLVSRFTGKELPAVGASIGVDRLFSAMDHIGILDRSKQSVTEVIILRLSKNHDLDYLSIASLIRKTGFIVEICLVEDTTFKSQFNFAINKGVNYVVICGEDEFKKQIIQVKNLSTRVQEQIPIKELSSYFENLL
jgi:histidyl-tRNA synthetase